MKAFILAAGLSTRMKPLTDKLPKPLVPFFDSTLLEFQKFYLNFFGIEQLAMNTHYHQNVLKKFILDKKLPIELFFEESILGTGGGIANMASFIEKDADFMVINCDFISTIDLHAAINEHKKNQALATMVLTPPKKAYGKVGYNQFKRLTEITPHQNNPATSSYGHFTGIHIFNQKIFDHMPKDKEFFCINRDVYSRLIEKKLPVYAHVNEQDHWIDVGELRYYSTAHIQCMRLIEESPWLSDYFKDYQHQGNSWIHPSSTLGQNIDMNEIFIGPHCTLKDGCVLMKGTILAGHNSVGAKNVIKGGVIAQGDSI
ncbi:NDP-sugar synthase [bacterium]|nr:NDP-sugar synthase [bacterium]